MFVSRAPLTRPAHPTAQFAADYAPFVGDADEWAEYVAQMARASTWAGHIEIEALSRCLARPIEVHARGRAPSVQTSGGAGNRPIRLWYADNSHYDLLLDATHVNRLAVAQALVCDLLDRLLAQWRGTRPPS